jgi:hypothetical protein
MELWKSIVAWWKSLSVDGKTATVIGGVLVILASLAIPGVIEYFKSEKPKETQTTPSPNPHGEDPPRTQEPKQQEPEEPAKPRFQYVPLPNAAPIKTPNTLVTAIPEGDNKPRTVDIGGEQIPIMTQAEVDQILTHKTDVSRFVITHGSTTPLDIWVTVGKDGAVKGVESASSGTPLNPDLKNDLKQWKFKPFELNGEHVAVQTVIQLDGKEEKKNRD